MSTQYTPAPEVKKIATELIKQHHQHLADVKIEYIFSSKTAIKSGKEIWGTMRKITSLPAYFAAEEDDKTGGYSEPFFAMVISEQIWNDLPDAKKLALVDHELCHGGVETDSDGNPKLKIITHDLEEFSAVVQRHGLWRADVQDFVEKAN